MINTWSPLTPPVLICSFSLGQRDLESSPPALPLQEPSLSHHLSGTKDSISRTPQKSQTDPKNRQTRVSFPKHSSSALSDPALAGGFLSPVTHPADPKATKHPPEQRTGSLGCRGSLPRLGSACGSPGLSVEKLCHPWNVKKPLFEKQICPDKGPKVSNSFSEDRFPDLLIC